MPPASPERRGLLARTAGAALLAAAVSGCGRRAGTPAQGAQEMLGFTMAETAHGKVVWTLQADSAMILEGAGAAQLKEPRLEFYKEGRPEVRVESRTGTLDTESHDVVLSSAVVARTMTEDKTLWTEKLRYDSKSNRIRTDERVRLRSPEATVEGSGLETDPDLAVVKLKNQRTLFHANGKGG